MAYPSTFTSVAGTTLVADADHAAMHNAVETTVGTTAGTNVLKNFAAGDFPARINGSNVLQQRISGTLDSAVLGTPAITAGSIINSQLIGTSQFTGGTITTALISGGTISAATLGTPVIDVWTSSGTATPSKVNVGLAPTVSTVTDAVGTLAVNAAAAQVFQVTLGTAAGNRTWGTPSNATDGQAIVYRMKQNAAATGTVLWEAVYRFSSEIGTPSLGTASTWNYYAWRYNATDSKWDYQGQSKSII